MVSVQERRYVLDIPGKIKDEDSERGRFVKELTELTGFIPGCSFGLGRRGMIKFPGAHWEHGYGTLFDTDWGEAELDGREFVKLVSVDSLNSLESLLKGSNVKHIKNPDFYELCCEDTTKEAQGLYFHNYLGEKLFFISSPVKLFSVYLNAFVGNHGEEDDKLERALVKNWLKIDADPNYHGPPTTLMLMSSLEAAEKWIEDEIYGYLEECVLHPHFGEKVDGAYLINNKRYRFPRDLTDDKIEGENMVQVSMCEGEVIKTYSDGVTLMDRQGSIDGKGPLDNYFDRKKGFEHFNVTGCERCCAGQYKILKERVLKKAVDKFRNDDGNLLLGPTSMRINYEFDFSRIKVSVRSKEEYLVHQT